MGVNSSFFGINIPIDGGTNWSEGIVASLGANLPQNAYLTQIIAAQSDHTYSVSGGISNTVIFRDITINSGVVLTSTSAITYIYCRNLTIASTGQIKVDALGGTGGTGGTSGNPGAVGGTGFNSGNTPSNSADISLGGIGGAGDNGSGSSAGAAGTWQVDRYNRLLGMPFNFRFTGDKPYGSGGGGGGGGAHTGGNGGIGGGAIFIFCTGTFTNNSSTGVTSLGANATDGGAGGFGAAGGAGGSGGFVFINAAQVAGSGTISVKGGNGGVTNSSDNCAGGPGGLGGYIVCITTTASNPMTFTVTGGTGGPGSGSGGTGATGTSGNSDFVTVT